MVQSFKSPLMNVQQTCRLHCSIQVKPGQSYQGFLSTRISFNTDHLRKKQLKKPDKLHKTTQAFHLDRKCHWIMEAKKKKLRAGSTLSVYRRLYSPEADFATVFQWYHAGGNTTIAKASNFLPSWQTPLTLHHIYWWLTEELFPRR